MVGSSSPSSVNQSLVHIEHKNDFILCCFDLGLCWNGSIYSDIMLAAIIHSFSLLTLRIIRSFVWDVSFNSVSVGCCIGSA